MASRTSSDSRSDSLNGSWVEVNTTNRYFPSPSPVKGASLNSLSLERLLREAQRESSRTASVVNTPFSSRQSPRSPPPSPHDGSDVLQVDDLCPNTEWVWDWSSRPEAVPPSDFVVQMKHPSSKWQKLSIRNTRLMHAIFLSLENLPFLLLTHACTFVLGAATMLMFLKKYCKWSPLQATLVDG